MLRLTLCLTLLFPCAARAAARVSAGQADCAVFVEGRIMARDVVALIDSLGGEDQSADAELRAGF